jgi:hypothetical protein
VQADAVLFRRPRYYPQLHKRVILRTLTQMDRIRRHLLAGRSITLGRGLCVGVIVLFLFQHALARQATETSGVSGKSITHLHSLPSDPGQQQTKHNDGRTSGSDVVCGVVHSCLEEVKYFRRHISATSASPPFVSFLLYTAYTTSNL